MTCFFIGHRDVPETVRPLLAKSIERHITEYGVTEFVVGHYGAFDRMAAQEVRKAKQRYPGVKLVLLLPYFPCKDLDELARGFDENYYPKGMENVPKRFAIIKANEHMIKTSDVLICYNRGYVGKTRDFVELALRREKKGLMRVDNLALYEKPFSGVGMAKENIFSQQFPDADPDAIMKEAEELSKQPVIDTTGKIPSLEELLKAAESKYNYRLRPDAAEKAERFISLAKEISTKYEIDTEITRGDYSVTADLFLYYAPYAAAMKRDIDSLILMADTLHDLQASCYRGFRGVRRLR